MADKKISALTALAQGDVVVSTDVLPIVDTSATETKKIAVNALVGAAAAAGLTNVDINSGTIDGTTIATSDITVGSGKTLNVSAGTLTLADNQISGDKVEGGTINAITINTLTSTAVNATTVDATNVEVTNIKAKDGTAAATIADSTGIVSLSANPILSGGTANGVLYLNGSKVATSGSALTFDGTNFATTGTSSAAKLIPTGGTVSGNGIYLPAANSIGITTSGTNAIRINSSQQTGFGNTAPAFRVHATQTSDGAATTVACLENGGTLASTEARMLFVQGGNTTRGAYVGGVNESASGQPTSMVFGTSAAFATPTERMRITSAGNVGIGTTSPQNRLHVDSGATASTGFFVSTATTAYDPTTSASVLNSRFILRGGSATNSYNAIRFTNTGTCENFFGAVQNASGVGQFVWGGYNGSAYAEWMRLDSSGNLGIGTTSPIYKLHVENNAASTTNIAVLNTSASSGAYAQVRVQGDSGIGYFGYAGSGNAAGGLYDADCVYLASESTAAALCIGTSGGSAPIRFFTNGSTAASERMRIDASGNLGIGTGSPTVRLDISGATNITSRARFTRSDQSTTLQLGAFRDTSSVPYIGSETNHALAFITNDTERARITAAGELLVGGTTAAVNSLITSYGNISFSGSGTGAKLQNRITLISVSTSATTIINAGDYGQLVIVNGRSGTDRFCDLVMSSTSVAPTVVQSFNASGSPAARTYTRSGVNLQLAMASGTYETYALALGF